MNRSVIIPAHVYHETLLGFPSNSQTCRSTINCSMHKRQMCESSVNYDEPATCRYFLSARLIPTRTGWLNKNYEYLLPIPTHLKRYEFNAKNTRLFQMKCVIGKLQGLFVEMLMWNITGQTTTVFLRQWWWSKKFGSGMDGMRAASLKQVQQKVWRNCHFVMDCCP